MYSLHQVENSTGEESSVSFLSFRSALIFILLEAGRPPGLHKLRWLGQWRCYLDNDVEPLFFHLLPYVVDSVHLQNDSCLN